MSSALGATIVGKRAIVASTMLTLAWWWAIDGRGVEARRALGAAARARGAVDITDPRDPEQVFEQRGVRYHGLRLSPDDVAAGLAPAGTGSTACASAAALFGVARAAALLRPGGRLGFEHADVQGGATRALAANWDRSAASIAWWTSTRTRPSRKSRCVWLSTTGTGSGSGAGGYSRRRRRPDFSSRASRRGPPSSSGCGAGAR